MSFWLFRKPLRCLKAYEKESENINKIGLKRNLTPPSPSKKMFEYFAEYNFIHGSYILLLSVKNP
jgi:hypothetical protein